QDYVARSEMSEAITLADGLKTTVADVWTQEGACPKNEDHGIATATDITGKYVLKVEVNSTSNCEITATMKDSDVARGIQKKTLTMTPYVKVSGTEKQLSAIGEGEDAGGSIYWKC